VTYAQGANFSHIFEIPDPDLPIHYTTSMALRRRLRAVYSCTSNVKAFFRLTISKYKIGPKISKMEDDLQESGCQKSKYSWQMNKTAIYYYLGPDSD